MKLSRLTLNLLLLAMTIACTVNVRMMERFTPKYSGVDPAFVPLVNEYMDLARDCGIKFKHKVTVGFMDIKDSDVIGVCHYNTFWREIDIDKDYWDRASKTSRMILVFHELSHAYCNREHDYGLGKKYDSSNMDVSIRSEFILPTRFRHNMEGFYPDGCPLTIMYPKILNDSCVLDHYAEYMVEMFNRCEEW